MAYRIGVKPGKSISVLGMIVGGLFVLLGVVVAIPLFGPFGLFWTAIAGAITLFYAYNAFSAKGVSAYEVDVNAPGTVEDLDAGLRKLAKLKEDGLIRDEEYEQKRSEMMRRRS